MKLSNEYMAGMVDADGYIGIVRSGPTQKSGEEKVYSYYTPQLMVVNRSKKLMDDIVKTYGGKYYIRKKLSDKHCSHYMWRTVSSNAIPILNKIIPYLVIKKEQARLCIKYQNKVDSYNIIRKGIKKGNQVIPERIKKQREVMWEKAKKLNSSEYYDSKNRIN
jgi:ribosome maturation protein Sdo1